MCADILCVYLFIFLTQNTAKGKRVYTIEQSEEDKKNWKANISTDLCHL